MDLSAVIFVLLAVAWAVYLIPKALRHHDEAARSRSIETFSDSTRVLARSEPADDRDTRLVVSTPRRSASRPVEPVETSRPVEPASRPVEQVETRPSARAAARRRRRILGFLLLCVAATAGAAAMAVVPWWSVAIPGGLTLAYLVLCRTQVRRAVRPVRAAAPAPAPVAAPAAAPVFAPSASTKQVVEPVDLQVEEPSDVPFDAAVYEEPAAEPAPVPAAVGSIWDPLPVTLPTYVTAPKAHRTVRTIDLSEPGTWTSGRTAEDAELAVQAAQAEPSDDTGRRAVGS